MSDYGPDLPVYTRLGEDVRRIVAPNPSMMTGPGTNTYLFGNKEIAVLDPGPAIDAHIDDIIKRAAAPIRWVLVTHTHPDHSPGATVLARETGAEQIGIAASNGDHQDRNFLPDRQLADGESLTTGEFSLQAVHTPGHASNHVCYLHKASRCLFTGDHVIDGSTVVINPPDGNMKHYIQSLQKVNALQCWRLAPGHGDVIKNPQRAIDWIIEHRLQREAKVFAAVQDNPGLTTEQLVPVVYQDVAESLYQWAERSLLAHLLKLEDDGRCRTANERWYTL